LHTSRGRRCSWLRYDGARPAWSSGMRSRKCALPTRRVAVTPKRNRSRPEPRPARMRPRGRLRGPNSLRQALLRRRPGARRPPACPSTGIPTLPGLASPSGPHQRSPVVAWTATRPAPFPPDSSCGHQPVAVASATTASAANRGRAGLQADHCLLRHTAEGRARRISARPWPGCTSRNRAHVHHRERSAACRRDDVVDLRGRRAALGAHVVMAIKNGTADRVAAACACRCARAASRA
jgi:hypothetical protein